MRFINPIPFVQDIERSKAFYRDVIGIPVRKDLGSFVVFEGGFALCDGQELEATIWGDGIRARPSYGARNFLLYFEDDDVDAAFARVSLRASIIHRVETQRWGQRVFRFFDPDGHVVEIGEPQAL